MKILKLSLLLVFVAIFASCEEEERAFPEFGDDDLATGAYARRIDGVNGDFNFFFPDESTIDFTVEFYDVNQGADIAEYNWTATHIKDDTVANNTGPVEILSVPASSFGRSDFGLPSTSIQFNFTEVLGDLGLTIDDVNGGEVIRFEATIVMNDGREFTRFNTGGNVVSGNSFRGLFTIDQNIVCPSDIGGTYDYVTVGTSTDGCCPDETTVTGTLTLTPAGAIGRYIINDWSGGLYPEWYDVYGIGPADILLDDPDTEEDEAGRVNGILIDACNVISIPEFAEVFGSQVTSVVSYDLDSGVIIYTWTNGFADTGTVTLTPQ